MDALSTALLGVIAIAVVVQAALVARVWRAARTLGRAASRALDRARAGTAPLLGATTSALTHAADGSEWLLERVRGSALRPGGH